MEECEIVLLVKPVVYVYKIPPRATNRGYRAADWKLDEPDWTGRLRLISKGQKCFIKLEDKNTGEEFAKSPIDKYPGISLESVTDSSRYFVLRIEDDNGRAAFIGIGFAERSDSFDLNVALQDHFKWLEKSKEIEQEDSGPDKPNLDLGFKEGQTITINMNIGKKGSGISKPRPKTSSVGGVPGLLPPPPGGVKIAPPPSSRAFSGNPPSNSSSNNSSNISLGIEKDSLLDFDLPSSTSSNNQPITESSNSSVTDLLSDLSVGDVGSNDKKSSESSSEKWIDF